LVLQLVEFESYELCEFLGKVLESRHEQHLF